MVQSYRIIFPEFSFKFFELFLRKLIFYSSALFRKYNETWQSIIFWSPAFRKSQKYKKIITLARLNEGIPFLTADPRGKQSFHFDHPQFVLNSLMLLRDPISPLPICESAFLVITSFLISNLKKKLGKAG